MLVIVALGGNALLRRGEPLRPTAQQANVRAACRALAPVAARHQLVITHGNGPQVGLLALQDTGDERFPLDVLDAETEGMIGYLVERELRSLLGPERELATLLTMVEVDPADPAFADPSKPIGPTYSKSEATLLARRFDWTVKRDGDAYRRVVASPKPQEIVELEAIRWLLERKCIVVCTGGGGIPVVRRNGTFEGIAAVIDKDLASALLACELGADLLAMATDVDGVYLDWGTRSRRRIVRADPESLRAEHFAEGSMGPKIEAACAFVERTGGAAVIGSLDDLFELVAGRTGTTITADTRGLEVAPEERDIAL